MSHIGDIITAMRNVINAVSSVDIAYTRPIEVGPPDGNLPAAYPEMPEAGEINWWTSHDERTHQIPWVILIARDGDVSGAIDAVTPVFEDVIAAFQTNQRLGLSYVCDCKPTGYETLGYQFGDNSYIGVRIMFSVKELTAVSFS